MSILNFTFGITNGIFYNFSWCYFSKSKAAILLSRRRRLVDVFWPYHIFAHFMKWAHIISWLFQYLLAVSWCVFGRLISRLRFSIWATLCMTTSWNGQDNWTNRKIVTLITCVRMWWPMRILFVFLLFVL